MATRRAALGDDISPMTGIREWAPNFFTAAASAGWTAVCRWESLRDGGQWWPKEKGLTWCMGSRYTWIVTEDQVPAILAARAIVEGLGLTCGYSIGSAARSLLNYCGPPQYGYKSSLGLLHEAGNAYLECHPGEYPESTLYDCKSYYYSILCRLPCWRLTLRPGRRLALHGDFPGELHRREQVLQLVKDHKLLRNALVGCMTGREAGAVYYYRGERYQHKGSPGIFRGAGLLVRRTAWELTRRASVETDSKLSNTDCVLCQGGLYPGTWDEYGLVVEPRHSGDAEVCAPTIFRVGPFRTVFYAGGSRFGDALPRPAMPSKEYHRDWLRPVA